MDQQEHFVSTGRHPSDYEIVAMKNDPQNKQRHNVAPSAVQLAGGGNSSSSSSSNLTFEIQQVPTGSFLNESSVIDSGIAPSFFDNLEQSGQVIFKGILDHNGTLVLDPAQFAALLGGVQIEQQQTIVGTTSRHHRGLLPAGQHIIQSAVPLMPLSENNKLYKVSSSNLSETSGSTEPPPIIIQTLSSVNLTNPNNHIKALSSSSSSKGKSITTTTASISKLISTTEISSNYTDISGNLQQGSSGSSNNDDNNKTPTNGTEIENQQPECLTELSVAEPLLTNRGAPYKCQECDKVLSSWSHLKRHKSEHLDVKAFQCLLCPMSFNFEINLKLHESIHEAEISGCLECQICPAKFSRLASLRSHVRVHEKEENQVCPECGDEFATKARLDTHLEEHKTTISLIYRCKLCGTSFASASLLRCHSKEHSAVRNQLKLLNPRRKRPVVQQQVAKTGLTDSTETTDNQQINEPSAPSRSSRIKDKKKLHCSICSKRFEKPSQLSRHMRIHTGEKPYSCNQCGRSFNQKNTLDSHILSMHEKLKPHTCHLCNCQFSQRGNLRAHVLKVHIHPGNGEKCFECEDCSCVFKKLASLNTHIAKVHSKTKQPSSELVDDNTDSPRVMFIGMPPILPSLISTSSSGSLEAKEQQLVFNPVTNISYNTQPSIMPTISEVSVIHEAAGIPRTAYNVKVKRVGQEKFHLCPYDCNKSFKKPSDLIRHIRIHTQERPYVCTICRKSFSVKSTLSIHMKTHADQKDWECRDCHKRFTVLTSLRAHERVHTGAKPFSCITCHKWFRTSSQRRVHMRVHSRNSQGLTGKRRLLRIGDTGPKIDLSDPLKITSAGLVPVPNRSIQSVVTQEAGQDPKCRPYRCSMCPSGFKKSSHLKQHQRSHTGERPYQCFQCFRSFISSGVLKNHIKTHEGVRAYKCKQCQLSFTTNGSLTRHMATHTDERSFVCPYCRKGFKTSVACRKHIKTHRSEFVALHSKGDPDNNQVSNTNDNNAAEQISVNQSHQQKEDDLAINEEENIYEGNGQPFSSTGASNISNRNVESNCETRLFEPVVPPNKSSLPSTTNLPPECVTVDLSDNLLQQEKKVYTMSSNLVHTNNTSVHFGDGRNNRTSQPLIHYSVSSIDDTVTHISLADAQSFENSIFTLQHGSTHIDLPVVSLSSLISTSSAAVHKDTRPTVFTQPATFVRVENANQNPGDNNNDDESDVPLQVDTVQTVITSENCDDEISKIRNSSRPISQQIYNEMQTAASTEVQVNMTELLLNNFGELEKGKVNICTHCGRGFKKRSDLVRHTRIHTGEKPFRCTACGKAFRVKSTREAHMRTHEGGKTVACHVCNNLFSTKSSLRVHLRLHTGSRPYKCLHCDRTFRTSGHRKAHASSHFKTSKEFNKNLGVRKLPPVQTIKDKLEIPGSTDNPQSQQVSHEDHHHTIYTVNTVEQQQTVVHQGSSSSSAMQDPVQIIGSLQVSMDGSQVQNIHLGGLDLSTLQISEELLQSLGSVIFVAPHTNQIITAADLSNVNLLGPGVTIHTESDVGENQQGIQQNMDIELKQSSSSSVVTQNHQVQQIVSMSDLETLLPANNNLIGLSHFSSNNVVVNNSPMLSSTSTAISSSSSSSLPNSSIKDGLILTNKEINNGNSADDNNVMMVTQPEPTNNKQCPICGKIFAKPSLRNRHMTVHTGVKAFKCDICSCTFNQKNSLDVHKYTHCTERPFACTSCPFKTVAKGSLKTHIQRAHPNANMEEMLNASEVKL